MFNVQINIQWYWLRCNTFCTCTCIYFRDNDIEEVLDHTFCVESHSFGQFQQHELKPGGDDIKVTEENKKEYVKYE
jgi:hypothetical protein